MLCRAVLLLCLLLAPALSQALAYQALALPATSHSDAQSSADSDAEHDCCAEAEAEHTGCTSDCSCAEPADCCPKSAAKLGALAMTEALPLLALVSMSIALAGPTDPLERADTPPVPPPNHSVPTSA